MGESKHTPGPWRHQRPNDVDRRHKVMSGPGFLDMVALPNSGFGADEVAANARLIAAAPELYDALADTLRILEAVKLSAGLGPKQVARMDVAKAALAKAGA